uniref:Uncharacterized protein n=1 Tax=Phenylobacterium glaciei TaxID=2803784 RepID=A0A974SA48_9CAUL|nr:hypothetical protein JKL49_10005 [Phenylobacterium glaciei]
MPKMFVGKQAQRTRPVDEVDGRVGAYVKLDYTANDALTVSLLGYDNNGDRTTVTRGQYAWRTRFVQVAARWTPAPGTEILAQAMTGETAMGVPFNGQAPADIGFAAVYVLVSHDLPGGVATARLDQFSVSDHSFKALDNNAEHGWAATAAWSTPSGATSIWCSKGWWPRAPAPTGGASGGRVTDQPARASRAAGGLLGMDVPQVAHEPPAMPSGGCAV